MKQSNATAATGRVAPYHHIPDYKHGMVLPDEVDVLYSRLSKDDKDKEKEDDSNSIVNQKKILGKYAVDNHLPNPVFFTDDGISGTTFEREQFQAAIALVEAGKAKSFVVKDMSRFGRDYLKVGFYTEVMFPDMGVRFIALYDNVDSDKGADDLTPFRNIMNEWYARDTSKKIRAAFRAKGLSGESLCFHVPYGYLRDPDDPKRWIVDEAAAGVVRQIFRLCMEGLGVSVIANMLRDAKTLCPSHHAMSLGLPSPVRAPEIPWDWSPGAVAAILSRKEYLGHTVNFKTYKKSYKTPKTLFNDPSEHLIFEGTHEAIVDQDTFDRVQQIREGRRRRTNSGRVGLFSGLAYCADCHSKMHLTCASNAKPEQDYYICSGFRTKKQVCGHSHYIRQTVLTRLVLEQIRQVTGFAAQHEKDFVELLRRDNADKSRKELAADKRRLAQAQSRIAELDGIIQQLYEDKVSRTLTEERFVKLSRGYEQEQRELQSQTTALAEQISTQEQKTLDLSRFLTQVRKHTNVTELTPILLNELVERIEIHAPDKSSGKRVQLIDIYFNFVGLIVKLDFAKTSGPEPKTPAKAGKQLNDAPQSGKILTVIPIASALG
jgi:hypothetical protein